MTVSDPGPGAEPLGRLLSREVNTADILAYLVERDSAPLLAAFGLANVTAPGFLSEVKQGNRSRVDAFVTDGGVPVALMELKVGAAEHGDQFARYDQIAVAHGDIPRHLVSLDRFTAHVPTGWQQHLLTDLLRGWRNSPDPIAQTVAGEAERALAGIVAQAAGPLGKAGRTALAGAMRHIAHLVHAVGTGADPSSGAYRTSGGQPMVVFWLPHPRRSGAHEWLCVDLRSEAAATTKWKLRLGVDVEPAYSAGRPEVRAHDLAMALGPALATSAFTIALRQANKPGLAAALSGGRHDGFRTAFDPAVAVAWRRQAAAGPTVSMASPLFAHDCKRRLTTVSHLDQSALTVPEVVDLVVTGLRYLHAAA